jgi:hypothetical protein
MEVGSMKVKNMLGGVMDGDEVIDICLTCPTKGILDKVK